MTELLTKKKTADSNGSQLFYQLRSKTCVKNNAFFKRINRIVFWYSSVNALPLGQLNLEGSVMINPAKIEEIAKQLTENMPQGMKNLAENFEAKTKQVLQNKLSQMDFVSREEFDIQSQVLIRTREKLIQLEERVSQLEAKLNQE